MNRLVHFIVFLSLLTVAILYFSGTAVVRTLSPQGCRMSWMSPSYVLQSDFDASWTPLARRYSLWLYREVGWEGNELHGAPVLFVPGNAGSSHQVRSIASSATRQFYETPYVVSNRFRSRGLKPLDFFAVEFNEDLSAFHGTTLDTQREYTSRAIDYILSKYPPGTLITVLGHSMGGIVSTALLPHPNISAIITMSTPHTLPPARFDRRVDSIYALNQQLLAKNPTPILSLCGGATDLMIPSESCILPIDEGIHGKRYRRTVFTSALEGSWSGVGHREMVWCHQVRWRVARAVLELSAASDPISRGYILDTWLRDGHTLPPGNEDEGQFLSINAPVGTHTYLLPTPQSNQVSSKFTLYLSQGAIVHTSPYIPLPLRTSIFKCSSPHHCTTAHPTTLKLVPNPVLGKPFPVPNEGSDESEGVVVFETDLDMNGEAGGYVGVKIEGGDGRGWIVAGFGEVEKVMGVSTLGLSFSSVSVPILKKTLQTTISFPNLISSSLLVYRLVPRFSSPCSDPLPLLPPLLQHTSHPTETHYFPLSSSMPILLHTHSSGPYIPSTQTHTRGLNLTIYTSLEESCSLSEVILHVDLWGTLGRWGVRYAAPAASWAVGIVSLMMYDVWKSVEEQGYMPSVSESMVSFVRIRLWKLVFGSMLVSLLPLNEIMWLGNQGEGVFVVLAPMMLVTVTGLVIASRWVLVVLMIPLKLASTLIGGREEVRPQNRTNALLSLGIISALIFLVVPWQVAFLGCYFFHLYTCASSLPPTPTPDVPIPLTPKSSIDERDPSPTPHSVQKQTKITHEQRQRNQHHAREHLLLLMTWLLPLTVPVLAVWIRTLYTAGLTTPFDGDHNVFAVLPFLFLVEPGWGWSWVWDSPILRGIVMTFWGREVEVKGRWTMVILAAVLFSVGPRRTWVVWEGVSWVLGVGVGVRFVRRYWWGSEPSVYC